VLPGAAPSASFGSTVQSQIAARGGFTDAYADFAQQTMAAMQQYGPDRAVTTARDVAAGCRRSGAPRGDRSRLRDSSAGGSRRHRLVRRQLKPVPGAFEPRPDR